MPAGRTYDAIASVTVSAGTSAVVVMSSIPSTYTDLVVVATVQGTSSNDAFIMQFNDDTGSNYSRTAIYGLTTSTAGSNRQSSQTYMMVGDYTSSATNFSNLICHIMNYSNTTTHKTVVGRFNTADTITWASVGLWKPASPTAINKITFKMLAGNNIKQDSTFTLYGITAA